MSENERKPIPIIDLFAGPGGLGEGFTSVVDGNNERFFKIALSIEKDLFAHQTLTLRSFSSISLSSISFIILRICERKLVYR
ncbi:MAG: hypothetical protein WKG06_38945 [Segetibacter sp.]